LSIAGYDRSHFEEVLKSRLSPTNPITSAEFLRGRDNMLEKIRRSFVMGGRHIFVHGDRGVGKTSLAQTAAFEHQSSDQSPVLLGCDPNSTFYQIATDLAARLCGANPAATKKTSSFKASAGVAPFLTFEAQKALEQGQIPAMRSINECVAIIDYFARRHSKSPVAVIDEFDRIKSAHERELFADFIKQVGDTTVPIKLIFCGVGTALDDLLDSHHSCYRYLETIHLERLGLQGRVDIIDDVHKALGVAIDDTTKFRIARISDGFPHYVHLICEKLLWEVEEDANIARDVRPVHFTAAVETAVASIEEHLRKKYEKATKKYRDDYEEVLWAVADDKELSRRSTDIFTSYTRIMQQRTPREPLSRDTFNNRMNTLKQSQCGSILKATRAGWYEFSENIIRGYVRLRAAQKGMDLEVDHQLMARKYPATHAFHDSQ